MTKAQRHKEKKIKMTKEAKILLPLANETAAITLKPKTAALCYDRIWGTSDDAVPPSIRCWGGSKAELSGTGLAADFNIKTKRTPIVAMVGPEEKKLEMFRAGTDLGLASAFRTISISFSREHGIPLIPIYDFIKQRNKMYQNGNREVVITTLTDLGIVDEKQLAWDQVIEFRSDKENQKKYKRFLHWLDSGMIGKSQAYIESEIRDRLEDYSVSLKKHGIRTVLGILSVTILVAGFVKEPNIISFAPLVLTFAKEKLDFTDREKGLRGEISWVYEVKKLKK